MANDTEDGGAERVRGETLAIYLTDASWQRVAHALLNSSTFHQFYCAYTDGRHINSSDVRGFPLNPSSITQGTFEKLAHLSQCLDLGMKANTSLWRKSGLLIESVDSKPIKSVIDQIDRVLAEHYGFTEDELDFVINYDFKYRMGSGADAGDADR